MDAAPRTRDASRTRRAVLDAAAAAVAEYGTGISLARVAELAGISKSGLLHHFGSREQLLVALVEDANERFRQIVREHVVESEPEPGRLLRAYVRALCGGSEEAARYFDTAPSWNGLFVIPGVAPIIEADSAWWAQQFALDGLDERRVQVVRRAAEGIAAAWCFGEESDDDVVAGGHALLALAVDAGPIAPAQTASSTIAVP